MSATVPASNKDAAAHLEALASYLDGQTRRLRESGSEAQQECCERIVAELIAALREDGFLRIILESLDGKTYRPLPTSLSDRKGFSVMPFSNIFPKSLVKRGNSVTLAPVDESKGRNVIIHDGDREGPMSISFVAQYTGALCRALVSRLQNDTLGEQEIAGINNFIRDLVAAVQRLAGTDFPAEPRPGDTCEVELGQVIQPAAGPPTRSNALYNARLKGITPASGVWQKDGAVSIDWSAQDASHPERVKRATIQSVEPLTARALAS